MRSFAALMTVAGLVAVLAPVPSRANDASAVAQPDPRDVYTQAVKAMNGLAQPAYLTYRLESSSEGLQVGLTTNREGVWLLISAGSTPDLWTFRHRTYDYASELIDASDNRRYLSRRSFFDPTWYGAVRALREGMLNAQDPAAPRPSPDDPTPPPGASLKTIGAVAAMGTTVYNIADRGNAACANGSPGRALHLTSRDHDPLHQLSDVVIDVQSMRFCMMRFSVGGGFGFHGIVEQHYADVGGFWLQTDGLLDGTLRAFGISTHHGVWRYRLLDMRFPRTLPPDAFAPSA